MKAFLFNILVFVIIFFATLVILEIYVSKAEIGAKSLNRFDQKLGMARRPNAKFVNFNEGFGLGSFNEYGYLGPGYSPKKNDAVLRIALVGDSYIEGVQVFDRVHLRNLLETQLKNLLQKNVEVLNFGRSGFRLEEMYVYDKLFVEKFNPDITLYFIANGNLKGTRTGRFLPYPVFSESEDRLTIESNFSNHEVYKKNLWFMQNFTLIQMTRNVYRQALDKEQTILKIFDKFGKLLIASEDVTGLKTNIPRKENRQLTTVQEKILDEINISNKYVINIGQEDLLMPAKYMDIVLLNTYELFSTEGKYDWSYHQWPVTKKTGHWNHNAHKKIALRLSSEISRQILQQ